MNKRKKRRLKKELPRSINILPYAMAVVIVTIMGKECWFTIKSNCFYFDKKSNSYPHYEEHIKRIHDKLCSMGFVSYQTYTQHEKDF